MIFTHTHTTSHCWVLKLHNYMYVATGLGEATSTAKLLLEPLIPSSSSLIQKSLRTEMQFPDTISQTKS